MSTTPALVSPAPQRPPAAGQAPPLVDGALVLAWFAISGAWMILGPTFGLLASMKLDDPEFLRNVEWMQYGRFRLAHVNGVIFGAFTPAVFGLMCHAVPRLCGRPLWGLKGAWAAMFLNAGVVVIGPTLMLLGVIQPIEAGELPLFPSDIMVTLIFVLMTAVVLMTVAKRREKKLYVTLWYWIAALVWTCLNYVLGAFILPYVPHGTTSAAMHGFYLHAVVGLWITPAGVGAAYYLLPVATKQTLFSHRLSIIGFWALAFFYPLNGIHHYLYSPIADWAQTIAISSSMLLILPVWAFIVNVWGTMRGAWGAWAGHSNFALKFTILGAVWYLLTCFQGPTQALRAVQIPTHFTDYNVGHAHSAVFAVFILWAVAAGYHVVPRASGRQLWSTRLATWTYWLEIVGFSTMFLALTVAGVQQGNQLMSSQTPWVDALDPIRPLWEIRTIGGTLMDLGLAFFAFNLAMTAKRGRPMRLPADAPAPIPAPAPSATVAAT
jgi:cytochrome c oxidase cbb3-type subunit 1